MSYEDEKTITLRKPVTLGAGDNPLVYTELKLIEPTAGQIARAQINAPTGTDVTLNLIHIVAKVPRTVAERLCQRDFKEAADFFGQDLDDGESEVAST
ncbi:MAG: phage tail assembly protein [Rhodanobacter sp.]